MKVYIPTMEELEQLQAHGVNIYHYIITKVTETIIMESQIYDEADIFEILENIDEHPEIIYAICKMYPKILKQSIILSKDIKLCNKLLSNISREDNTIYKIDDYLMNMDESILFDEDIIKNTINFISNNISSCPKYRFDYQCPNKLLDSIFSCELPISKISTDSYEELMVIDPIYCVKLGVSPPGRINKKTPERYFPVHRGMAIYTGRYGIDEYIVQSYQNKDIINKPDDNVKKLIRCLDGHRERYKDI